MSVLPTNCNLPNIRTCDIILMISVGETGENPVRARRRKVQKCLLFYPLPQQRGQVIEKYILEKAESNAPQSKYPQR